MKDTWPAINRKGWEAQAVSNHSGLKVNKMPPGYIYPLSIFKFTCANMKCHACCLWSLEKITPKKQTFKKSPQMILNSNFSRNQARCTLLSIGTFSTCQFTSVNTSCIAAWSTKTVSHTTIKNTLNSTKWGGHIEYCVKVFLKWIFKPIFLY